MPTLRTFCLHLALFLASMFGETESLAEEARLIEQCPNPEGELIVSFLAVGQGDATLIQCPDGETQALIDAGESSERYPDAEQLLLRAIAKRLGEDKKIETAISTHPHQDHLFGFSSPLRDAGYSFQRYFDKGTNNPDSELEELIRKSVQAKGGEYVDLSKSSLDSILLCPKSRIHLRLLKHSAEQDRLLGCPAQLNDCSILSRLDYKGVSFLFMADSLLSRESLLLKEEKSREFLSEAKVMSVGHHGSSSTSKELLQTVRPWLLAISTGEHGLGTTGKYDFPQHDVLERLKRWISSSGREIVDKSGQTPVHIIHGCKRREGTCRWKPSELPYNAWSTAVSGSLDILVQDNFMCVSNDLRTINIEFSF